MMASPVSPSVRQLAHPVATGAPLLARPRRTVFAQRMGLATGLLLLAAWLPPAFSQDDETPAAPVVDVEPDDVTVAGSEPVQVIAMDAAPELARQLKQALADVPDGYEPRTEHFLPGGEPKYINRLMLESSPYLLQHAHNPVNWYPWGEDAFAAARQQQKPVFLSIGYATCHWCHVMERESFENEAIAELMNEAFISIKVDREQLPDVDALFMSAVQMISGSGGWPMSSFLDTQGRPFHGGTYFPPAQFTELLNQIATLWRTDKARLLEHAGQISAALNDANALSDEAREVGEAEIKRATVAAMARYDDVQGGFSEAPKFPQESLLYYLLEQVQRTGNEKVLDAVDFTLEEMAAGGIHDQIGGGFHRYSVDNEWLVPHFEKMLYNQGALARNYAQASQLTGNPEHERVARGTLDYVLREMTTPEGLFYSATDADSEGEEGTFFVWTPEQIISVLGEEDGPVANRLWGVSETGNFEHRNILHRPYALHAVAEEFSLEESSMPARVADYAQRLREHREQREHPLRDDKIITAWNALMITALAEAGELFDEPRYVEAATRAAQQLWNTARYDEGQLWRAQYDGKRSIEGKQADYAYFAEALLALYDLSGDPQWLQRSEALVATMLDAFWDEEGGGFYMGEAAVTGASLTTRPKDLYDSSMPSGNAVALRVLARLHRRTDELRYSEYADKLIGAFSEALATRPGGFYYLLTGASEYLLGETGARQYAGRGVVKARAGRTGADQVEVTIDMAPGWHINSHQPVQDYLIPTALADGEGKPLADISYPQPVMRSLGFERTELSLFEGQTRIQATLPATDTHRTPVSLRLQACSDEICLAPETLTLMITGEDAS